ncbi:response regulator transcription factor [Streptomyces sp. NPDC093808]|uniref:response regulator transcription factor n=1 Tax=unclassified Streptomyces TaxID=2593676 RepID=UPI0034502708
MIRVLLADDEAMVRAGVRAILDSGGEAEVVAEAGDGREAVELARAHRPDVALLDVRMPRLDGLAAAEEVVRTVPGTAVAVLTTFSEHAYVARALAGGATGFLLKSGDPYELLAGVRAVARGAAFLSPTVARYVIEGLGGLDGGGRLAREAEARARAEVLSPREREVLGLVGAGLSNPEIAARLHLVEGTVKAYVSAVLDRLGVRNRVQAAIVAYEAGLVDRQASGGATAFSGAGAWRTRRRRTADRDR